MKENETTTEDRKTFPIRGRCTKCGHEDNIWVDDAAVAKSINEYIKSRHDRAWGHLMLRRIAILLGIVFTIGILLGRFAR